MVTLGIAIPCYKRHIPHLKKLLLTLTQQTRLPNKVVVSCSSSHIDDFVDFPTNLPFPTEIKVHPERLNAAQNRNIAAKLLDTDIISFFDADDTMHPQRLQAIANAFETFQARIVLHSYKEGDVTSSFPTYNYFSQISGKLRRAPTGCAILSENWSAPIHHAHVSIERSIIHEIQFREDTSSERKEDSLFCGDVLKKYPDANVYISQELSYYIPEGQWYSA
jgi:glycosyltransferase involved in cell wall biosynthesis